MKAQIHSGARGKAGGIRLCTTYHEVHEAAQALLGKKLVTVQTGPEGKILQRVYVEVAKNFERELYLGIVLDRCVAHEGKRCRGTEPRVWRRRIRVTTMSASRQPLER